MQHRIRTLCLILGALALGWLIYEAHVARVAAEGTNQLLFTLDRDTKTMDKPSELHTKVTCPGGTETEVITYQKEGETAPAFASRHFATVAAVEAACPEN